MPRQAAFFETVDYPMADAFEAAEYHCIDHAESQTIREEKAREENAGRAKAEIVAENKQLSNPGKCLHCSKPSKKMFCSATCKTKWQSSMNSFYSRLPKAKPSDTMELF
jgi:hypothetical protein